jgi:hypothetical protein
MDGVRRKWQRLTEKEEHERFRATRARLLAECTRLKQEHVSLKKQLAEARDAEGEALLRELGNLTAAVSFYESDGKVKRVRHGSSRQKLAEEALRRRLMEVGERFRPRGEFNRWLNANACEHIESHDPLRRLTHYDLLLERFR